MTSVRVTSVRADLIGSCVGPSRYQPPESRSRLPHPPLPWQTFCSSACVCEQVCERRALFGRRRSGVVWRRHRELETQLSGPANPGVDFRTNLNNNLYQHEQRGLGRDG